MRILITGGGTGGHLYPALATADILKKKDPSGKILFVGSNEGIEKNIVPSRGYSLQTITTAKWPSHINLKSLPFFLHFSKGYLEGLKIIKDFKPQVILATGGYVCVPLALAAATFKIPLFLHEQNIVLGKANALLARWAKTVCTTFPVVEGKICDRKSIHTGLPVRQEIIDVQKEDGLAFFNFKPGILTLLVTGGSRGARYLNEVILAVYEKIIANSSLALQVIHITGKDNYEAVFHEVEKRKIREKLMDRLFLVPYLEDMQYALAAADIVVSRAGAATLSELLVRGLPGVLVPYPYAAGNHQYYNALYLQQKKAAMLIPEKNLTPELLAGKLERLALDINFRQEMSKNAKKLAHPDAGERIVDLLMQYDKKNNLL